MRLHAPLPASRLPVRGLIIPVSGSPYRVLSDRPFASKSGFHAAWSKAVWRILSSRPALAPPPQYPAALKFLPNRVAWGMETVIVGVPI